jgi:hypothetical protein
MTQNDVDEKALAGAHALSHGSWQRRAMLPNARLCLHDGRLEVAGAPARQSGVECATVRRFASSVVLALRRMVSRTHFMKRHRVTVSVIDRIDG